MQETFYICAVVALLATLRVVISPNPVHALLYLVVSLFAVAGVFFTLGAPFAGALEVIVYAGAIMVLFVFVVMMLNLGRRTVAQEREWLRPRSWVGPMLLAGLLLVVLLRAISATTGNAGGVEVTSKELGIALFGPYVLAVELASLLLLGALVSAYHLGRDDPR